MRIKALQLAEKEAVKRMDREWFSDEAYYALPAAQAQRWSSSPSPAKWRTTSMASIKSEMPATTR